MGRDRSLAEMHEPVAPLGTARIDFLVHWKWSGEGFFPQSSASKKNKQTTFFVGKNSLLD